MIIKSSAKTCGYCFFHALYCRGGGNRKAGREEGEKILKAISEKLLSDPSCGKRLKGNLAAVWSFRTGDYRVLYTFNDSELVVLVLKVGHTRDIYER